MELSNHNDIGYFRKVDTPKRFAEYGDYYSLRDNDTSVRYFNFSEPARTIDGKYTTGYNHSYEFAFDFEKNFDTYWFVNWMSQYHWVCNVFIALYLCFIHLMSKYMKDRPRFELRKQLVVWNIFLAAFSIGGAIRTFPEMVHLVNSYGFNFCVCFSGKTLVIFYYLNRVFK